ncbi:MAG: smalltalk protein [Prevotella sp.]|nr:smalltalk protein [Prevotella sp.]MBR1463141.1 smalltalk protein [Prevotella sp.]
MKKNWKLILKVIIAVLTAILGVLGGQAAIGAL